MANNHRLINNKWYPRVTHMLGAVLNKGVYFDNWLKTNGWNSERLAMKAADSGTKVHNICEALQKKGKASLKDCDEAEYKKIRGFVNWVKDENVKLKEAELVVHDDQCCGRFDILCEIEGKLYIVDIKSGAGIYDSHRYQVAFYSKAWNSVQPGIATPALLHLKSTTKKGYQFIKVDYEPAIKGYEACYELYKLGGHPLEPKSSFDIPKTIKM